MEPTVTVIHSCWSCNHPTKIVVTESHAAELGLPRDNRPAVQDRTPDALSSCEDILTTNLCSWCQDEVFLS